MNDNEILMKRITELSRRSFERGYSTFSEFLNIDEISEMSRLKLQNETFLFGGYDNAERCVAGFGEDMEEYEFPIICIKIEPTQQKFADKLTHRDFLGSLMNLGINRNVLGDIKIKDNVGYLFCLENIAEFIVSNMSRIKHTTVKCKIIDEIPAFLNDKPDAEEITVSSLRSDAVVASVYRLSRSQAAQLFNQEKVFINSRVVHKESIMLKEEDIVSVRGLGKFIFEGELRRTKKDRLVVSVRIYK